MFDTVKKYLVLLCLATMIMGCATQVKTFRDPKADFNQYHTFCWMNGCDFTITAPEYLNDTLLRKNIKNAIVAELNKKGLTEDANNPDLLIGFTIAVKDEQAIVYHREGENPFYVPMDRREEVVNYLKGTIVIGIADKKQSKMVWESQASRYMELQPDLSEKNVRHGIHLVLKNFPAKKK